MRKTNKIKFATLQCDQTYNYNLTVIIKRLSNSCGVLTLLKGWHRDPFTDRPDVIGQARRHRWCSLSPTTLADGLSQRPHRPAEIVAIDREIGHRLMHLPVFRECVGLPHLPGVAVSVRRVLTLHERGVDVSTRRRLAAPFRRSSCGSDGPWPSSSPLRHRHSKGLSCTPGTHRWSPDRGFVLRSVSWFLRPPVRPLRRPELLGQPRGPNGFRNRSQRDPNSRRDDRRRDCRDRSGPASCRHKTTFRRIGLHGSSGEKATTSSWS